MCYIYIEHRTHTHTHTTIQHGRYLYVCVVCDTLQNSGFSVRAGERTALPQFSTEFMDAKKKKKTEKTKRRNETEQIDEE